MRFAYADPPYPGMAHYYPEKREVNHGDLMRGLCQEFPDGWALSTASTTLAEVLAVSPVKLRVAAWMKTWVPLNPGVHPGYTWEPVLFTGGRPARERTKIRTSWDSHAGRIAFGRGLVGAKPEHFFRWMLDLLGYEPGDEMVDVYPGTGTLRHVVANWHEQLEFS